MHDEPVNSPAPPVPPWPPLPEARPVRRGGRALKLAVGLGAVAGVAVGATALAQAATSGGAAPSSDATVTASGATTSTTTTVPAHVHGFAGPGRFGAGLGGPGGLGALGGPGLGAGPFIYGQFTLKGPNGYETISERSGTVSDVTDTSGSTWSLTVKSADGTSGTFTVDSGTSVNGGEMGIGSVKTGDTVRVTAVVSGGTSTAKQVTDQTVQQANGGSWRPTGPPMGSASGNSGPASTQTLTPTPPL
jgi:hypothetical protein